jgi:rfaE bifunctional protein kinase chain/domain
VEAQAYKKLVGGFDKARIAVVGDIVADIYIFGKPHRLSREAPVIVVRHEGEKLVPGSAANTAHNLMALGATVYPVGVVGDDPAGHAVVDFFDVSLAKSDGIIIDKDRFTTTKTRIMAGDLHTTKQQVIRIDKEPDGRPSPKTEKLICEKLEAILPDVDGVIVSDYGYDVIGPDVIRLVRQAAGEKIVVVDSRSRLKEIKGAALATPNESEAEAATGIEITSHPGDANNMEALAEVGRRLLDMTGDDAVLMTRGNRGMTLFEKGAQPKHIPICGGEEIVDVSGAGDTVAATAALGLVGGGTFLQAANLANFAAGLVVMKSGTATTTREEILDLIELVCGRDGA